MRTTACAEACISINNDDSNVFVYIYSNHDVSDDTAYVDTYRCNINVYILNLVRKRHFWNYLHQERA